MQNLDPIAIDPNTSYRLTRNSFRVLSIAALDGFDQGDKSLLMQVFAAMEAQHHHIHQPCFDQQAAQENHQHRSMDMSNPMSVLGAGVCAGYFISKMLKDSNSLGKVHLQPLCRVSSMPCGLRPHSIPDSLRKSYRGLR